MSDLLGRLVDRALDAGGGGLRPRASARFEAPAAEAPGVPATDWQGDAPAGDVEQEERPAPPRPAHRQVIDSMAGPPTPSHAEVQTPGVRPATPHAPTPATAPELPAASRGTRTGPRPAPDPGGVAEPAGTAPLQATPLRRPRSAPMRAVSEESPHIDAVPAAPPSESEARSPVRPRSASQRPTTAAPAAVSTPLEPTSVAARVVVTRRADVGPETDATADRASIDAPHIVDTAVPHREPRSAPRFEPPDDADAWPGPGVGRETRPVVRVSIGRIEVRAVTAPAAPVRPAAPPPTGAPSLEEYLRARNGTRR